MRAPSQPLATISATPSSAEHGADKSNSLGPRIAGILAGTTLLVVSVSNAHSADGLAMAFAVGTAALAGCLLSYLVRWHAIPAAVLVILLSFAYLPSAWDAIATGIPTMQFRITSVGLTYALTMFIAQLLLTALGAWLAVRGSTSSKPGYFSWLDSENGSAFTGVFLSLLLASFIASVIDGQWSAYAPGRGSFDEQRLAGGFRLALLYPIWLPAACALVGIRLASPSSGRSRLTWLGLATILFALLFVNQGRRLMLTGAAMLVLPQFSQLSIGKRTIRTGLLAAGAVTALLVLFLYGSLVWRSALERGSQDTASQLKGMSEASVSADDAVKNFQERLTYLWLDAAAMELAGRVGSDRLLEDALVGAIAGNVPGMLFPDKYKHRTISCETLLLGDRLSDLPCTPFAEGVLLGGELGLALVTAGWLIALIMATALHRVEATSARVLACVFIGPLTLIESSAFPVLACIRNLLITLALVTPLVWVWRHAEAAARARGMFGLPSTDRLPKL